MVVDHKSRYRNSIAILILVKTFKTVLVIVYSYHLLFLLRSILLHLLHLHYISNQ